MNFILKYLPISLERLLASLSALVDRLEHHASKSATKADQLRIEAAELLDKASIQVENSYKASRVAGKVRDLIS